MKTKEEDKSNDTFIKFSPKHLQFLSDYSRNQKLSLHFKDNLKCISLLLATFEAIEEFIYFVPHSKKGYTTIFPQKWLENVKNNYTERLSNRKSEVERKHTSNYSIHFEWTKGY